MSQYIFHRTKQQLKIKIFLIYIHHLNNLGILVYFMNILFSTYAKLL